MGNRSVGEFRWNLPCDPMTSRLRRVKAILREVGRCLRNRLDRGCLECSSHFMRLRKYHRGEGSFGCSSIGGKRRQAPYDGSGQEQLRSENTLKEAVASLISRSKQGAAMNSYSYVGVLQGCFKEKDLESVKEVHDCVKESPMKENPYVVNNLLKCYIGCGSLQSATQLFNKFLSKSVVSWNVMIGGLARHGQLREALSLFHQMHREGFTPDFITYLSILSARGDAGDMAWVNEVHRHATQSGLAQDLRVSNALIHRYVECGSVDNARLIFDSMSNRNVISWNVMIGGLAQHGLGHEAFSLFLQMQREGLRPDPITYVNILNPCSRKGAIEWVREVNAHAAKAGLDDDLRVGNALVHMYTKVGSIDEARRAFDKMRVRDIFSWTVMIGGLAEHGLGHEAFSLFLQMQREGLVPDSITYLSILNPCSCSGALEWVKEVHRHAMKAGLDVDLLVGSALVHMFVKTGSIGDARQVFDKMLDRDVVTWNVMIGGLAEHGLGHQAYSLFLQMQREGFRPDSITYLSILNSCSSKGALEWVKEVHADAVKAALDTDLRVGNALVHMYTKIGNIGDARQVFDKMRDRDVFSWTMMIGGLAQHGLGREAFTLFLQMQREGFTPNVVTYLSILNSCSSNGALDWVKDVHAHAVKAGLDTDLRVGNAIIHMYARTGSITDARQTFDKMMNRDVVSWTVMIGGLAQHGQGRVGLRLFEEMKDIDLKPSEALFVAVLSACSHAGLLDEGRFQFSSMTRDYGIEPALEHYSCIIDILGRAGHLEEAKMFILNMPIEPDKIAWMVLLGACRNYKNVKLAELAAKECIKLEPSDASPYVLLSNVYAAVGNWDQRSLIRKMMEEIGVRKDPGRCWIEVDNNVHHFVAGDTTHPEIREIYVMLNSLVEKIKAEGYIPDTRLVLRNMDEEGKESALCSHSEKLAIAYGLMHVTPEKPIRIYKNLRICTDCHAATKLIAKITGREIVARDANRFHHFKDGSCSCGDYW